MLIKTHHLLSIEFYFIFKNLYVFKSVIDPDDPCHGDLGMNGFKFNPYAAAGG